MKMNMLNEKVIAVMNEVDFSGNVLVKRNNDLLQQHSDGFANRTHSILNNEQTRFGIASGCKIFTAVAICQLAEKGQLSFDSKLSDILEIPFPRFDEEITIHHLLTHTAGIPDYFDEEVMEDFADLWVSQPMYLMRNGLDFLPLFQLEPMKFKVGERFHYNNAGYILLGLVVEQVSGKGFDVYVTENIFKRAEMEQSGYFELDALPRNTALGYIDEEDGSWKSNIYSVPVKGGADGGAFITVEDMHRFWQALMKFELLGEAITQQLLTPYINTDDDYDRFYGYGVWIDKKEDCISKYHVMGYDPGVSFHSAYYPESGLVSVVCSNKSEGAFDVFKEIENI
ncbi:serine hydrolase domain-containing protein [Solibacillus isronensis]|uniref:serine hydrolase domain-containing protein n=1 Tax=Solibacillus isronensis TaxID=412383 RepID=UPI00203CFCC7|nr:serine hydrolase [Solibacillus isronensis]MCM3721210.1 beta-lactamase family protein [Solibacillus isronensis]